jgi:hypothetical protein
MTNIREFRTMHFNDFRIGLVLFQTAFVSIGSLWILIEVIHLKYAFLLLIPISLLPLFVLIVRSSKVRIGADFIETVTLFKTKTIAVKDIKSWGVLFAGRSGVSRTKQQTLEDCNYDVPGHTIYLSTNDEFDLDSFRSKENVVFYFQKEIYFIIKEMTEKAFTQHQL